MESELNMHGERNAKRGSVFISKLMIWLWNPKEQLIMGCSLSQWIIVIVFYVCFVCCVIGLFIALCFASINFIINSDKPWLQMGESLIGSSPGMGYRPAIHLDKPLIWYKWTPPDQGFSDYVSNIYKFLYLYSSADEGNYRRPGDAIKTSPPKPYYYNLSELGPCANLSYGYPEMQPCVYIKINKLYGWKPDFYVSGDKFPASMPTSLQEQIKKAPKEKPAIWVSCGGLNRYDAERIGTMEYFPGPSFDGKYFPFLSQKHYLSPLIAIRFLNITQNLEVTVKCRAWAKNLKFGEKESAGTLIISFMLGSKIQ